MPRSFARLRIAPGIYRDGDRLVAHVRAGSSRAGSQARRSQEFPLGTDVATMKAWQHGEKRALLLAQPAAPARGSLAADIPAFVAGLPVGRYRVDSEDLLAHWAASDLGAVPRAHISRDDIRGQIAAWRDAGVAASTCNRRLGRLRKLYGALDGPDDPNPTDKITFQPEPEKERRDIPAPVVKLILSSIPDQGRAERFHERPNVSLTKLRLSVFATTGIPPATLARVKSRDIDWAGARIYLRARRKGKGADPVWVALLPDAVDALRAFVDAGLLGKTWSNSSAGKSWRVGIARAKVAAAKIAADTGDESLVRELDALPPRCKPYDLRHSFASEIYAVTGDILAVKELLQHANLSTTTRYTKGAVSARVAAAIATAAPHYAKAAADVARVTRPLRLVHPSTQ